jgi:hypothetical protein
LLSAPPWASFSAVPSQISFITQKMGSGCRVPNKK